MPLREINILLMKNSSPLKRGGMLRLTCRTMTQLRAQRFFLVEFVFDFAAVARGGVEGFVAVFGFVDAVGWFCLPILDGGGVGFGGLRRFGGGGVGCVVAC